MKLVLCKECQDVFKLASQKRNCECGKSSGRYLEDGLHATYHGPCVPIGFENNSLRDAIINQPKEGQGKCFTAFVIPKECDTMAKVALK